MTDTPFRFPAALMLSMALVPHVSAQALPAGATPADKEMTCADIAAEHAAIDAAVAKKAADKASGAKVKKGLFGFAKRLAGTAAPMMLGGLGGGSMIGAAAAQSAGYAAGDAINAVPTEAKAPAAAGPDAGQQARLDRLAKIGAYRQCA